MRAINHPLVSVIIPFFNEEKFLEEAIASVMHQDYTHWELLLVNDGSSDNSKAIAQNFAREYPEKIKYCEHENQLNKGLSATRNEGIKQAKGELIAFLDADDVWLAPKLSTQVAIFQQHPQIAMVAEASEYWYSWNSPEKPDIIIPVGAPSERVYEPASLLQYLYPLSKQAAPCPSGLMVSRQAMNRCGGFEESFSRQNQLYEDQAFLHKIYLKEPVYISSACNNKYRQRPGSIVQWVKSEGHYLAVRKYFLDWLTTYLEKENLTDPETYRLLQRAYFPYRHPDLYFLTDTLPGKAKHLLKRGYKKIILQPWQS